mmetsp:Transcript_1845/g.3784  ORF Transcript_1845/g.3784 Transcript_1845/m.3784 type:complete len:262 (-) Transcript_1845:357-1142(-)
MHVLRVVVTSCRMRWRRAGETLDWDRMVLIWQCRNVVVVVSFFVVLDFLFVLFGGDGCFGGGEEFVHARTLCCIVIIIRCILLLLFFFFFGIFLFLFFSTTSYCFWFLFVCTIFTITSSFLYLFILLIVIIIIIRRSPNPQTSTLIIHTGIQHPIRRYEHMIKESPHADGNAPLMTVLHGTNKNLFHKRSKDEALEYHLMMRTAIARHEYAIAHLEGRTVGTDHETDIDDDLVGVAFFDFGLDGGESWFGEEMGWDADGVG